MIQATMSQSGHLPDGGPPLAWVLTQLAATGASGVLRAMRPRGPAFIHVRNGKATRVEAEGLEPLFAYLLRKELILVSDMRSILADVEHLNLTLAEAFERHGLLNREVLEEIRARRTSAFVQQVVAAGSRVTEFQELPPDEAPPVELVLPVFEGLLRSGAGQAWLASHPSPEGVLQATPRFVSLRAEILDAVGEHLLPVEPTAFSSLAQERTTAELEKIAALVIMGLYEVRDVTMDAPEELERRAKAFDVTEEACRLLIRASELYEAQGNRSAARRAALAALRRRPTAAAPLVQVERLCVRDGETATLELVYELVQGAMPGPHGRRATLYRAARVFEREVENFERANDLYERALVFLPESGAVLDGLERTAERLGRFDSLAEAYGAVALGQSRPEQRNDWLEKAAQAARRDGDEARAQGFLSRREAPPEPPPPLTQQTEDTSEDLPGVDIVMEDEGTEELDWSDLEAADSLDALLPGSTPGPAARGHDSVPQTIAQAALEAVDRASQPHRATPSGEEDQDLVELCGALALAPADLHRLESLRQTAAKAPPGMAKQAVEAFLSLFHKPGRPLGDSSSLKPIEAQDLKEIATPPEGPNARALALLWTNAPQLVTRELSELGVGRAIPQAIDSPSPATLAFDAAWRLLRGDPMRLLHLPTGPVAQLVLSRPLVVLTGPGGMESSPDVQYRIARAVAMAHPHLVLPCALSPQELHHTLQAVFAAFGSWPASEKLDPHAASLAQDLWVTLSPEQGAVFREALTGAELPDAKALRQEAQASANAMALLVTGDIGAALRAVVNEDSFLAGTDPSTAAGYQRAVESSDLVADLVRLALWPRYWALRLGQ